jgi:TPR repeat protein
MQLVQEMARFRFEKAPHGYAQTGRLVQEAAERGDLNAQMCLAKAYIRWDPTLAAKWFLKAAEQGNAEAQGQIGKMYDRGEGAPKDERMAVTWFRRAAQQGSPEAQYDLALMYKIGSGVPQDYAQALSWYQKAAEQGYAGAQYGLGGMYAEGKGVSPDFVLAYAWANLGASGPIEDDWLASQSGKMRDQLAIELSPDQLAEAQRLSSNWQVGQSINREKR